MNEAGEWAIRDELVVGIDDDGNRTVEVCGEPVEGTWELYRTTEEDADGQLRIVEYKYVIRYEPA